MSLEKAKAYLESKGFLDHVIELKDSTATVNEAAEALGVQPAMIAKTMSFLQGEKTVLDSDRGNGKGRQPEIQRYLPCEGKNDSL